MGLAAVPSESVPPAATVTLPCTTVKELLATVLNCRRPLIVVVLAVAVLMSIVTVLPATIVAALQVVGTAFPTQVAVFDQFPFPGLLLIAPHPPACGPQVTLSVFGSSLSCVGPPRAPDQPVKNQLKLPR